MTDERVYNLTEKISGEMKNIGIPVSDNMDKIFINNKTRKRLGACLRKTDSCGREAFSIEISAKVLACNDFQLSCIIAHELLHTCPGSFNHGKKWKEYGQKTEKLLGYHIKRTIKLEEFGISETKKVERIKYTVICKGCGQKYYRRRMCPLIKNPGRYRCGKCGGRLKRL